jgi:carbon-monoxide dehydrogenase medium subunit
VLLALGADLVLRSATGERTLAARDFFLGPFLTALEPGELLTEIVVPLPDAGSGSAYESFEHPASGFALAGAAALVPPDGARSVAVTGISAQPLQLEPEGQPDAALAKLDVFGDHFAAEEYRRHLAAVLIGRALERAQERRKEDERWQA